MWCCSITKNQEGYVYPTYIKRRKINCVSNIMRKNGLLKRVIEGQIEGKIEVPGRGGERRNNLWMTFRKGRLLEIQKEALDHSVFRTGFGKGYVPVARQKSLW